jgi:hypothetical protein
MKTLLIAAIFATDTLHERSKEERTLFESINKYRAEYSLPPLQYCDSLSYIAHLHSMDIYFHQKFDDKTCSMHSWSPSRFWKGGCVNGQENADIMWDKPKELLGMQVDGFEIAHMHDPRDIPCDAKCSLDNWKSSAPHNHLIIERGWRRWKRMGVSIYKGVATVWFARE